MTIIYHIPRFRFYCSISGEWELKHQSLTIWRRLLRILKLHNDDDNDDNNNDGDNYDDDKNKSDADNKLLNILVMVMKVMMMAMMMIINIVIMSAYNIGAFTS